MKYSITENRFDEFVKKTLEQEGITYDIGYAGGHYDNNGQYFQSIDVWFRINGEPIRTPSTFTYKVRNKKIISYEGCWPELSRFNITKYLGGAVEKFFEDKTRNYLEIVHLEKRSP